MIIDAMSTLAAEVLVEDPVLTSTFSWNISSVGLVWVTLPSFSLSSSVTFVQSLPRMPLTVSSTRPSG